MFELTTIAVFSAQKRNKKPTGLCRKCCKTDEVESLSFPNGITKANNTPVTVA
jgi:hypothetical protein